MDVIENIYDHYAKEAVNAAGKNTGEGTIIAELYCWFLPIADTCWLLRHSYTIWHQLFRIQFNICCKLPEEIDTFGILILQYGIPMLKTWDSLSFPTKWNMDMWDSDIA